MYVNAFYFVSAHVSLNMHTAKKGRKKDFKSSQGILSLSHGKKSGKGANKKGSEGVFLVTTSNTFVSFKQDFSVNTDS